MAEKNEQREEDWCIDRILAGDGSTNCRGLKFELGRFYASGSLTADDGSFHEINLCSLRLWDRGCEKVQFSVVPVTTTSKVKPMPIEKPRTRICKSYRPPKKQRLVRDAVRRFCLANPGFAVVIGGPGLRSSSPFTHCTRVVQKAGPIFMRAHEGQCLIAAIVNAVDVLIGRSAAERAKHYLLSKNQHYRSVASCAQDIHVVCPRHDLRKVRKSEAHDFKVDKFDWLGSLTRGVWIVRLVEPKVVDHCIVIDGKRKLIIDSAESFPLHLGADVLRQCGGDEAQSLVVAEVRQITPVVSREDTC